MGYINYLHRILPCFARHERVSSLLVAMPEKINLSQWKNKYSFIDWISLETSFFFQQNIGKEAIKKVEQFDPDVIFIPTSRFWKKKDVAIVNMVRNMEPLVSNIRGNHLNDVVRNIARALSARMACRRASRVIAVSHYVGNFLLEQWHISPEKIAVIYHGTKQLASQYKPSPPPQIALHSQEDFLFTAGSIRPARGLEDILCAVKRLMLDGIDISKLVIAGSAHPKTISYQRKLKSWIETNKLPSKVYWVGTLNEEEMAWCYMNCRAFIMTSRVEACPNIALEAMSHRCICISADNPPLPEIFDGSSIYYTAGDGEDLAETMKTVFAWNDDQRKSMSEKAGRRAAEFSWDVCAKRTIATLIKAANK